MDVYVQVIYLSFYFCLFNRIKKLIDYLQDDEKGLFIN